MSLPTLIRYSATSSLPRKPMTPATMTAGMFVIGCGLMSRLIDSQPANSALNRIIASTNRPARSSARRKPKVYERVAARPPMANAIHSGTAVSASEKLWTVSASSATEPEMRTTPSCSTAVTPSATSETWTARIPRLSPASAESSESAGSWLWPTTAATIEASRPVGWAWPWASRGRHGRPRRRGRAARGHDPRRARDRADDPARAAPTSRAGANAADRSPRDRTLDADVGDHPDPSRDAGKRCTACNVSWPCRVVGAPR